MSNIIKGKLLLVGAGVIITAIIIMLAIAGNPQNMALCIACFVRDTAGALYLQTNDKLQYVRPEIIGIAVGALIMAFAGREFKATAGSSPLTRFFLGFIVMVGALIFLGCPLRMVLRMSAGDLNAWVALVGFAGGILTGTLFLKKGFTLGRAQIVSKLEGLALPVVLVAILVLSIVTTVFAVSTSGPASAHAFIAVSIIGGLIFGAVAQRACLCFSGGIRDSFLIRDASRLIAIGVLLLGMIVYNVVTNNFKLSFDEQPIAHSEVLWNILGMYVVGFGSVLLGGCPLRQLVLAGNGSADSAVTVLGLFVGAAFAHNFGWASSASGTTQPGQIATVICIVALFGIAMLNLKTESKVS